MLVASRTCRQAEASSSRRTSSRTSTALGSRTRCTRDRSGGWRRPSSSCPFSVRSLAGSAYSRCVADEGDLGAVQTAVELARSGYAVGIFPEGTRRSKGLRKKLQARPHSGPARVALAAGVPLVPAAVVGTERLTALRRWQIAFGEPVSLDDLPAHPRLAAREATERVWSAISVLEAELLRTRNGASRRLRPRLVPDISLADLLFALRACVRAREAGAEERVLDAWAGGESGLVCLSVRSAFDLLLEALAFEPGDEVAISAITHPDMVRVLEAHGLRALPVDVDPDTLTPRADLLERLIGPRTRALLVAHLFGARADLEPLADVSRRHGLLLIEDCAQSFRGPDDAGSPLADVSLFSFGAIKTATALGGSLVRVQDPSLLERMHRLHGQWPAQRRRDYAARVLKFVGLVALAKPRPYWLFERSVRLAGKDFDSFVADAVKGFPGPALLSRYSEAALGGAARTRRAEAAAIRPLPSGASRASRRVRRRWAADVPLPAGARRARAHPLGVPGRCTESCAPDDFPSTERLRCGDSDEQPRGSTGAGGSPRADADHGRPDHERHRLPAALPGARRDRGRRAAGGRRPSRRAWLARPSRGERPRSRGSRVRSLTSSSSEAASWGAASRTRRQGPASRLR